jgi:PPP family 3-phenylpropionic acid transporter
MTKKPPYFRLSLFYLLYFGALGSFAPYWPVYLKHLNFNAIEIGQLMSVFMATKLLAPFVWGWLSDYSGQRLKWIRVAAFLTIPGLLPIFFVQTYGWIVTATILFGFFWNASMPQFEALTLNHLGTQSSRYSWVRLWGGIGFILAVAGLPYLFEFKGIKVLPWVLLLVFTLIWVSTGLISDKAHHAHSDDAPDLMKVLKSPVVIGLLVACILQTISHGAYYTFFSIYLESHNYSSDLIGRLWALGVLAEVILFVVLYRLFNHFHAYHLFVVSLLLTAIRWLILGLFIDNLAVVLIAQCLHAASFGLFHASAIHLIHDWFPGQLQGRGQAIYAGLSFGLGGAVGSLLSGYFWELTSATLTFLIMAVIAFAGWLIALSYHSVSTHLNQ